MTYVFTSGRAVGSSSSPVLTNTGQRRMVVQGEPVLRRQSPDWAPGSYTLGAKVIHSGRWWVSTAAANVTEPGTPGATWDEIS